MFSINRKLLLALQKDSNRQNHSSSGSHHSIKYLPPLEITDPPSPPLGGGVGGGFTPHSLPLFGKPREFTFPSHIQCDMDPSYIGNAHQVLAKQWVF